MDMSVYLYCYLQTTWYVFSYGTLITLKMLMYYISEENILYVCWYSFISHIFISLLNHLLLECPNIHSLSCLLYCDVLEPFFAIPL